LHTYAQGNKAAKEFDELWNKVAQKSGKSDNVTKDLNTLEKEKIEAVDIKDKYLNPNAVKMDTTDLEKFSTKPVIKGVYSKPKTEEKPAEVKEVPKTVTPAVTPKTVKEAVTPKPSEAVKPKAEPKPKTEPKKQEPGNEFSTAPVIKGKKTETESTPAPAKTATAAPKKFTIDTTKSLKDFTFETPPVINKNANYSRKDEPMPKSKQQIDDEIPVNKQPAAAKENAVAKETYAMYNREADSIHLANKRRLDSIMKSLNISVPVVINPADFIDIFVSGGGAVSSNDSRVVDRISILNSGVVQREFKTKTGSTQRTEKKISRDELTKLAQYIIDMGFLDFKSEYDCSDTDDACSDRFKLAPQPVPLTLSLTVGQHKNKVNVSIFSPKTDKNWVNYPQNLEKILNAVYAITEK
jgi:hypothetical protein